MQIDRCADSIREKGSPRVPDWTRAWFPILLLLTCLAHSTMVFCLLPADSGRNGDGLTTLMEPFIDSGLPAAIVSRSAIPRLSAAAGPLAAITNGFFSLPAETETLDDDPVIAKNTKPSIPVISRMASWPRRSGVAGRSTIPLYIYLQSLLC